MDNAHIKLTRIQDLVLSIQKVERNHRIPKTNNRENVVEHSFSVTMLCWRVFNSLKPKLNLERIFKYALVHDFPERGKKYDINTYANKSERLNKKEQELNEIKKISGEFIDFKEMTFLIKDYDDLLDEESRFVWSIDKIQALILGNIDKWRPYRLYGVTYEQFYKKCDEFILKCSPSLKEVFSEIVRQSLITYYDQPKKVKHKK